MTTPTTTKAPPATPELSPVGPLSATTDSFEGIVREVTDYCIFLLNADGVVASWNDGAEKLKGYTTAEIVGRHFSCFYPPEAIAADAPAHALAEARAHGRHEEEGWRLRRDGSRFWGDIVITALHDPMGHVRGFAKVTRDDTERRRATLELQRSNEDLQQFTRIASHDLQEPLRTITSYVQLLKRRCGGSLGAEADEYIEFAVDAAARMKVLIIDLLAFSQAGQSVVATRPVSTGDAVATAVKNLTAAIEDSCADVVRDALPEVDGDANQLTQLFQNLISNAIKFRGESPPHIEIAARRDGAFWSFSVSDNGIGIPTDQSERVFDVFQRLHTRSERPGNGVGLAICRKVVQRHGGRIWVESTPGQGSTFRFTLAAA